MAGNYVGVNALARSGEAWPSVRLSSTLHANFWWNYFLRKSRFSLLSERRKAAPQQTRPVPESRFVSSITIIIARFTIKQFESLFGRKDRIELKSRSWNHEFRITFEFSNIKYEILRFPFQFSSKFQKTMIKLLTVIKLAMRYSDNSMCPFIAL